MWPRRSPWWHSHAKQFAGVLDCETALWWKVACEHFKGDPDMMEQILPSASTFAETVQK